MPRSANLACASGNPPIAVTWRASRLNEALASVANESVPLSKQVRQAASCQAEVVLPWSKDKLVDEKFPDHTESSWKLGFYAASRASQMRRMRAPRPQVNRGDKVS